MDFSRLFYRVVSGSPRQTVSRQVLALLFMIPWLCCGGAPAAELPAHVFIEAEGFKNHGGWLIDQQSMDYMGSPYLLAHGLGVPVNDAMTTVEFPRPGSYRLWVRTRDWVAPWKTPETPPDMRATGTPGVFQVLIEGVPAQPTFGTEGVDWHWQDGGLVSHRRTTSPRLPV